jgi:hypothetical protein
MQPEVRLSRFFRLFLMGPTLAILIAIRKRMGTKLGRQV